MTHTEVILTLQRRLCDGLKSMGGQLLQTTDKDVCDLTLNDFYQMFWDDDNIIVMDCKASVGMGFSDLDSYVLSEFGIPAWAAPNFEFSQPKLVRYGFIGFGEDRYDRQVLYSANDRLVFVENGSDRLAISVGIDGLVFFLVAYAMMVECAISSDRCAAINNRIPMDLIFAFESIYKNEYGYLYDGSFVEEEVGRLRYSGSEA
ncbi:MAG TPA: hypothetical protein VF271_04835 [Rhodanobacteraceae bacterium]